MYTLNRKCAYVYSCKCTDAVLFSIEFGRHAVALANETIDVYFECIKRKCRHYTFNIRRGIDVHDIDANNKGNIKAPKQWPVLEKSTGDRWIAFKSLSQHYSDVIMSAMASQITSVSFLCPTVCSDERKDQRSPSLAFWRPPVASPHKGPVTRKMFPFDDVFMKDQLCG